MLRTFLLSSLMLVPAGTSFVPHPQDTSPVVSLAVVRSDGILVPFAVLDGTSWRNPWPAPLGADSPAPGGLFQNVPSYWRQSRTPLPPVWRLWHPNVRASLEVRVLSYVGFEDHCLRQTGLLTDFRDVTGRSFRKILASHGAPKVDHPLDIRDDDRNRRFWPDLTDSIRSAFTGLEDGAIAGWEAGVVGRPMVSSTKPGKMPAVPHLSSLLRSA